MASLLDIIKRNQSGLAAQQAPLTDETSRIQGLLRAKSGKAVGGESISNLGEQAAGDATTAQLQAQAPAIGTQMVANDISARRQELETGAQQAALDQSRKFDTAENKLRTQQVLSDLARQKGQLGLDQERSRLEQAAFLLSMQDKQYTDQLQDVGRKQRLDNASRFGLEQEKMAFGSALDLLKSKLGNADILSVSDEQYKDLLSQLSVEDAQAIAELDMRDQRNQASTQRDLDRYQSGQTAALSGIQAQSQGLQELVKAGTQGYAAYTDSKGTK